MLSMVGFFWIMVFLAGIIGALRGWAREWLVTSSVVLAFLIIWVMETYAPSVIRGVGSSQPTPALATPTTMVMPTPAGQAAAVTPTPTFTPAPTPTPTLTPTPTPTPPPSPLETLIPPEVKKKPWTKEERNTFWFRTLTLLVLAFFGYQTPRIPAVASRTAKGKGVIADLMLGFVFGMLNGYLIVGSVWYFLDRVNYPFHTVMVPPDRIEALAKVVDGYIRYMPPNYLLSTPGLFVAVIIAFVFVITVLI